MHYCSPDRLGNIFCAPLGELRLYKDNLYPLFPSLLDDHLQLPGCGFITAGFYCPLFETEGIAKVTECGMKDVQGSTLERPQNTTEILYQFIYF